MSGHIQKQLTRSLERILEEAHLSGELKLSGRKLKDFPKVGKTGTAKYNLQDTVIAGESPLNFVRVHAYRAVCVCARTRVNILFRYSLRILQRMFYAKRKETQKQ